MEEKLISAVYKRKAIWDPADELRKNARILKSLWEEIAKEVGVDVKVAKSRWKNLRAYFISQLRELDKPRSGSGDVKIISSWEFYNQLLFLKDVLKPSKNAREDSLAITQSSQLTDQTAENYSDSEVENLLYSFVSEVSTDKGKDTDISRESTPTNKTKISANQSGSSREKPTPRKSEGNSQAEESNFPIRLANINKRKLNAGIEGIEAENKGDDLIEIERRKVQLLEKHINAEENSDMLFFKSLLPYMKEFTPIQNLRIRAQIQNLILAEYEAQHNQRS